MELAGSGSRMGRMAFIRNQTNRRRRGWSEFRGRCEFGAASVENAEGVEAVAINEKIAWVVSNHCDFYVVVGKVGRLFRKAICITIMDARMRRPCGARFFKIRFGLVV